MLIDWPPREWHIARDEQRNAALLDRTGHRNDKTMMVLRKRNDGLLARKNSGVRRVMLVIPALPSVMLWASLVTMVGAPAAAKDPSAKPPTSTRRFVSLRFETVNVRKGPSTRFAKVWIYKRKGLPVEVLRDIENWRLIRDRRGSRGWIHVRNLTSRRTITARKTGTPLYKKADDSSPIVARLGMDFPVRLVACSPTWCRVRAGRLGAWVKRPDVWGVYPKEKFE